MEAITYSSCGDHTDFLCSHELLRQAYHLNFAPIPCQFGLCGILFPWAHEMLMKMVVLDHCLVHYARHTRISAETCELLDFFLSHNHSIFISITLYCIIVA